MNKKRLAIARMIVVVALCSLAFGCGSRKVMPMDRTGWKTHCIGRFLVELPTNAEVSSIYKIWGDEFRWMSDDPVHLQKMVIERRAELERIRRGEGNSFVEMVNHEGGGVTLLSWDVELPDSNDFMWMDSYFVGHPAGRVFNYSGGLSAKKRASALDFASNLSRSIVATKDGEAVTAPGYCVDKGVIIGDEFRSESFNIGVTLPNHPGMNITLFATTQGEVDKETLLDRTAGTEAFLLAKGAKRLRKGKRAAGGGVIPGEEYLVVGDEDGQRKYGFTWESPGKADSVAEPYMTVELQVLGQSVVDEDHPYKPAFASDEEALQLWDAILESLRPRPGAASPGR